MAQQVQIIILILFYFCIQVQKLSNPHWKAFKYTPVNKPTAPFVAGAIEPLSIQDFTLSDGVVLT